jgi:hypothetical protein
MAFTAYQSFFKPDELEALTAAYDDAWKQCAAQSVMTPAQEADIKERLAKMILASTCAGERNIKRLTEIALRGVGKASMRGNAA